MPALHVCNNPAVAPLRSRRWLPPLALAVWCGVLFLYGLNAGPLYRTESLRAVIGAECLRGHWLFPVLYGEPFLTKPPGQYVAVGLCGLPFGEVTDWSARLPSVFAATAAVFLVAGMFRRVLGERAGWLAGFLVPTSVLWLDKVPSAEIDMTLLGWVTAFLVLAHRAIEAEPRRAGGVSPLIPPHNELASGGYQGADAPRSPGWLWLASLFCLAAGTLTKWTAPAFFALTVGPLLAWRRQLRVLVGWRFLLAAGVAVAACGLWAAAVAYEVGWDTLADTIRKEAAYRFHPPPKAKGYPWAGVVTFPLLVLAAHLPLSLFAFATLRPGFAARWDDRGRLLLQFLHCWTWPSLLFWALVPNHNVRYALPMSPGLMGLGVMGVLTWANRVAATRSPRSGARDYTGCYSDAPVSARAPLRGLRVAATPGRCLLAFLALWLAAKVVFVEVVVPRRAKAHDPVATAARLRELVPPGETVRLFRLKDEGVMFYYGRPALRCRDAAALPRPAFVLLLEEEWAARNTLGAVTLVERLYDQQGDPIVVAQVK